MADDFMSEEDKALFRDHMRTVKPLAEKIKRAKMSTPAPAIPPKKRTIINSPTPAPNNDSTFLSDYITDQVLSDTVLSFCHQSVPSQRFRALRNGEIAWENRLDLHGFKSEAARDSLSQFIRTQSKNNKRCLLIIHGKGGHQGAPPVIKNLVNRWLPQFNEVLAFHSAKAKDGGHGAVYVLLRRNRDTEYNE
ncbi:MAG: Smr/MutS family protein [Legionella sp.]|nr:Smr/MutS family protein [Legionella sp.]